MSVFKKCSHNKVTGTAKHDGLLHFFHPLSLCVVAPFDLDGVPPRTLSPRSLPTPLGTLAPFREVLAYFAGVSNNHPAGHSVVLFFLLFKKTVTYQYESSGSKWPPADRIDM